MARDPYRYFRVEARELADQLGQGVIELERGGGGGEIVPRLLRLAHTLKGAARVVRQPEIAEHAHAIEGALSPFRELAGSVPQEDVNAILRLIDAIAGRVTELQVPGAPAAEETFRVRADVTEIDDLLDGVTEANAQLGGLRDVADLAARARRLSDQMFEQLAAGASARAAPSDVETVMVSAEMLRTLGAGIERGLAAAHERIDRELRQVRDAAEQLRLIPAGALFTNFERAARDSAQALGKEILFEGKGGDIRLDAHVVRVVQDALLQLIRNAVAHGVEARRDRIAAGKPPLGRIVVTVLRRGRKVVFRCDDDGRGIDVAALREAAIKKGREAAELDRLEASGLVHVLLQGGISTSPVLSEVAGRGIGMDIVREAVARLDAELAVSTEAGKGTSFELIVPLSVSSVEALVLEASGVKATIPLHAVSHTLRLEPADIHRTSLGESVFHNGQAIPLVTLSRLLGRGAPQHHGGSVSAVVVVAPAGFAAVSVSRLLGTANVVFRSLPDLAPATAVVAGASLDAVGKPLLMLDPEGLVAAALQLGDLAMDGDAAERPLLVVDDSLTTRMLEQSILESAGYEVDLAVSAEEGLERVRQRDYGLILVDVEMPGMDGFSFIEQIRRDPKLRDIPAILVTSRNAPEDRRRGIDVGAQGYVVKSEFDQAELLDRIRQLVA